MQELGYKEFVFNGWLGVLAPAGTPQPIIDRIHKEIAEAVKSPEILSLYARLGMDPAVLSPQAYREEMKKDFARYSAVAQRAGIEKRMSSTTFSALQTLVQHARSMSFASIPKEVLSQARLCILDTVGCILAGSRTEEAQLILGCEPSTSRDTLPIFGTSQCRGLHEAMRINAYLGDVLELNDLLADMPVLASFLPHYR